MIIVKYRFMCNQKVDFTVKQGQQELRQTLIDQRTELLNIFQDDRQQMIEEHTEASMKLVESLKEQHRTTTVRNMLEMRTEHEQQISKWEEKLQESELKHKNDMDELNRQMNMALQ